MHSARRLTFGDIIREHRRSFPDGVALVDGEVRLTWPQLDERTNRLAQALTVAGVGPGDRILWLGQNSFSASGNCWAPPRRSAPWSVPATGAGPPRNGLRRRGLRPQGRGLAGRGDRRHGRQGAGRTGQRPPGVVAAARCGGRRLLRVVPGRRHGRGPGRRRRPGLRAPGHLHRGDLRTPVRLDALAPQPPNHGREFRLDGDIGTETAFLGAGPMFHIGNYQFWGVPAFVHGGKNVVVRRVVAEELLPLLAAERCTHAYLMPPTIAQLVALNREAGHDLSHLRASVAAPCGRARSPRTPAASPATAAARVAATARRR